MRGQYHRLGQSTYELDLARGPSRRLSADPNVIERANSSLVALMSSVHVTIEDVRTLQCSTDYEKTCSTG
jgi:hypothetical protein